MPKFKHKRNGNVIEVSETHAQQVIRRQRVYEEINEEPSTCQSNDVPETESEDGNGVTPVSAIQAPTPKGRPKSRGRPSKRANGVGNSK